ncbi:lamin tail domain-containing protein [Flavobacteriales bacterium]|nr:lamin tail domain-containing protein [Flavobacteriales bacterium]
MRTFLLSVAVLLTAALSAQTAHLAMLADPTDASNARFVKIANNSGSTVDLTGWYLKRWTNGNADPQSSQISLTDLGTLDDGSCYYIAASASGFEAAFGFAPDLVGGTGGAVDSNGDDQVALFDGGDNIVDLFGVIGEDGSDTCHDFEDGYALRTTSAPDGDTWVGANWTIYSDFSNATGCVDHNANQEQLAADIALLVSECGANVVSDDNACGVNGVVVEAGAYFYEPADLEVAIGDTVVWVNVGGSHDVNGNISALTGNSYGNPEAFSLAVASGGTPEAPTCIGSYTFTVPGVYNYDCSVGNHASLGMVATVTVGTGGCTDSTATNYNAGVDFEDGSCTFPSAATISAIQQDMGADDDGTFDGQEVTVSAIVTGVYGSNTSIQDGEGPWSGIFVYVSGGLLDGVTPVAVGDSVLVTGTVGSFSGGTQLSSASATILNSGNALPAPAVLSTADANLEEYEGVLCQVTGAITGEVNNFGEFPIDDGSGNHNVDDLGYDGYTEQGAMIGDSYRVTGAINGGFGNSIEPRDADDFQKLGCTNPAADNYDTEAIIDDDSCNVVDGAIAISTIQQGQSLDPPVFTDSLVTVSGTVTGVYGSLFSVQQGQGANSGIFGFNPEVALTLGDFVSLTGVVNEYFGLTQLEGVDGNPIATSILSQGNDLPAVEVLGTGAANMEEWEAVLVQSTGTVSSPDLGNGEWGMDDTSGELRVDDRGWDHQATGEVVINAQFQVTGPLHYSFGNFMLLPRDEADVLLYGCVLPNADNYTPGSDIDDGSCTGSEPCNLFFSECAEGSSNNKYLEVYNPTSSPVSLALYTIASQSNGANNTDPTAEEWDFWNDIFPTGGSLAAGETFMIVHPSAEASLLDSADATWQFLSNGDDAFALMFSATASFGNGGDWDLLDVIGEPYGLDPGSAWDVAGVTNGTVNHTLRRKSNISFGNGGDWVTSAGTSAEDSEWIVLDNDYALNNGLEGFNSHEFTGLCATSSEGCTDPLALNYDPNATVDDGSCLFIPNVTIQEINQDLTTGIVTTSGIVTGVYLTDDGSFGNQAAFTMQNGTGAFSGYWVRGSDATAESIGNVQVGDEVEITGTPDDWFGNDYFPNPTINVISSGNPLPAAEVLATGDVSMEEWEAVLLSVTAVCDNPDLGFAEWSVNDGSGGARVNDRAYDAIGAGVVEEGRTYRVTAPTGYAFGNWKLEPRDSTDVVRLGCTDATFPNYWPLANEDDGSCANIPGCTDAAADNYNPDATSDDGSCVITGCTDETALNYDATATIADNTLCYYTLPNIIVNEIHYNPCDNQGGDFDWEFVEFYNAGDEADISGFEVWSAFSNPTSLAFAMSFPEGTIIPADSYFLVVPGLVAQSNYQDMGITVFLMDNGNWGNGGGTAQLQDAFGNILDAVTYDDAAPWPSQEISVLGNILAASPDGGCASLELIATNLNNDDADNWQNSWVDNGTPGAANSSAFGCTDGTSCNYLATALFDDGSCTYDCLGCTYESASNYDADAIIDDGNCELTVANPCPTDLNGDGTTSVSDLLILLGAFATDCE